MHSNITRPYPERLGIILLSVIGTFTLMGALVLGIRNLGSTSVGTMMKPVTVRSEPASVSATGVDEGVTRPPADQDTPRNQVSQEPADKNNEIPDAVTAMDIPPENVVALVNDEIIDLAALNTMRAADLAMADLLAQPTSGDDDALLERLINGALVNQAAQDAGFSLTDGQIAQSLTGFLSQHGKSVDDLQVALAARGLTMDAFTGYFSRLLVIDGFLRSQSQALGMTPQAYLRSLQEPARISFGPASENIPALTQPETISAPPADDFTAPTADLPHSADPSEAPLDMPAASEEPGAVVSNPPAVEYGTNVGQFAPLFDLPALNYSEERLALSDLAGQPVLLSFWTTWCPYCRRQTPVLVDAYSRYRDQGVQFVGIDVKESRAPVANYIDAHQMEYPVVLDAEGATAAQYAVRGFPTTYFVDGSGRVVARYVGQLSPEQVNTYLDQLLAASGQ